MWDSLSHTAIKLLARGHHLYGPAHVDAEPTGTAEQLGQRATRLTEGNGVGLASAAPITAATAAGLARSAAAERELSGVLADASADHALGHRGTRRILDDARSDSLPAADTPLGRQEALRRMATRLRHQHHYLHRSHRNSQLLARRLHALTYPHRRRAHASRAAALPLRGVRYEKVRAPIHVKQWIAAALDHMGITDPAARRNWMRGYTTLIARESGGRAWAVASEPATAPGGLQPDGHGLGFARGLAQTIPATFARYHQPGTSTNIYDPVANICASMNYVIHRYGVRLNGDNLAALVQQADAHRPPKGY
jgi:SLT domain-containing protein